MVELFSHGDGLGLSALSAGGLDLCAGDRAPGQLVGFGAGCAGRLGAPCRLVPVPVPVGILGLGPGSGEILPQLSLVGLGLLMRRFRGGAGLGQFRYQLARARSCADDCSSRPACNVSASSHASTAAASAPARAASARRWACSPRLAELSRQRPARRRRWSPPRSVPRRRQGRRPCALLHEGLAGQQPTARDPPCLPATECQVGIYDPRTRVSIK